MAYSDFSFEQLEAQFGLRFDETALFARAAPVQPSPWLVETLRIGQAVGFAGEKSRSERLVSPVLLELGARYIDVLTVQSGVNLNANAQAGLNGECDFILSYGRLRHFLTAPVFCVAEAKRQDMDLGMAQCAAQLIGAWHFNQRRQVALPFLYGCATTGTEWRFMRFEDSTLTLDAISYFLNDLPPLLGVLQAIVDETRPFAPVE